MKCFAGSPSGETRRKTRSHHCGLGISPRSRSAAFGTVTIALPSCSLPARSPVNITRALPCCFSRSVPKKMRTGVQMFCVLQTFSGTDVAAIIGLARFRPRVRGGFRARIWGGLAGGFWADDVQGACRRRRSSQHIRVASPPKGAATFTPQISTIVLRFDFGRAR